MRVKILIQSQRLNYCVNADSQTKDFRIDGHKIEGDCESFMNNVISIVKNWPENLKGDRDESYLRYTVAYKDESRDVKKFEGSGGSPDNFRDLLVLIDNTKQETLESPYDKLKNDILDKNRI